MMECTTGLTDDEFDELLAWLREEGVEGYPPILGLSGSLQATLIYLRHNIEPFSPEPMTQGPGSARWCGKDGCGVGWCAQEGYSGRVAAHCSAGHQGSDEGDLPDPGCVS